MRRLPPCATRTDTRLPYTTLFRSSFGATTLRTRHANLKGATLSLRFVGKSGRKARIDVDDRLLARVVRRCQDLPGQHLFRSEEHTSELQSLMRISYAVFCLQKKRNLKPM